jgi:hypothetical protein
VLRRFYKHTLIDDTAAVTYIYLNSVFTVFFLKENYSVSIDGVEKFLWKLLESIGLQNHEGSRMIVVTRLKNAKQHIFT